MTNTPGGQNTTFLQEVPVSGDNALLEEMLAKSPGSCESLRQENLSGNCALSLPPPTLKYLISPQLSTVRGQLSLPTGPALCYNKTTLFVPRMFEDFFLVRLLPSTTSNHLRSHQHVLLPAGFRKSKPAAAFSRRSVCEPAKYLPPVNGGDAFLVDTNMEGQLGSRA